jgi:hypothetical protein
VGNGPLGAVSQRGLKAGHWGAVLYWGAVVALNQRMPAVWSTTAAQ